jgi:hypothetical protein
MSPFWAYFWPVFALGLALGLVGGFVGFRSKRRWVWAVSLALALGGAILWHGPIGAADRFTRAVEASARTTLVDYEMTQVTAHLHRAPLTRRLVLSGQADDFQRSELVRILSDEPGVSRATWSSSGGIPLLLEAEIVAFLGFLAGLLLAYVIELRRRYNAQWKW